MSKEKQIEEMAKCCIYHKDGLCVIDSEISYCDLMCKMFGFITNLYNAGYRKIPTTDWLTKGVPQEQLEREKEDAFKEVAERLGYRKQSEDTVEVIRCKDCNYCEHCYPTKAKGKEAIEAWRCHFHERYVNPDDFCSFAKMKGGAE